MAKKVTKHKKPSHESKHLISKPQKRSKWLVAPFAILFALFGLVIVWRSFAAVPPAAPGDTNDVIYGGIASSSTAVARASLITKMNSGNPGAKQLFTYYGITETEINKATLVGGFNPRNSAYSNWYSFGRVYRQAGSVEVKIPGGYTFIAKPVKNAWAAGANTTGPNLIGKTKDGRSFIIHAVCGNLAISTLTPYHGKPAATITKIAVSPAANSQVKPGDVVTYRITVRSTGDAPAYVRIADSIPSGTTFVSEEVETKNAYRMPDETVSGIKYLVWLNAALNPGDSVKVLLKVKVNDNASAGFCNSALYSWTQNQTLPGISNKVCHNINNTPTLKVTKTPMSISPGATVGVGDVITYKIVGQNTGTGASTDATFTDKVVNDGNLQFVELGKLMRAGKEVPASEIKSVQNGYVYSGSNDIKFYGYVLKSMKAGDRVEFTIKLKVLKLDGGKVCNMAVTLDSRPAAYGVLGYSEVCNPIKTVQVNTPALNITKEAVSPVAGSKVRVGDVISYKVTVKNTGTGSASNVVVNDPFPTHSKGGKIDRHSGNSAVKGFSETSTASAISWKYSALDPGAVSDVFFKVTVQDAKSGDKVCNVATITSTPGDISNEVCHEVSDLVLAKSAVFVDRKDNAGQPLAANSTTVAKAGDVIEYTLSTKNTGSTAIQDYAVVENLEDILEYADLTDQGGGTFSAGAHTLTWKIQLAAGATVLNKFKVRVKNPVPQLAAKPTNPASYDYKMYNIYGNDVTIPVDQPITHVITDVISKLPQTGAIGIIMIPLVLLAGLALAYSMGIIGGKKPTAATDSTVLSMSQGHVAPSHETHKAASDSAPHKAGDVFEPNKKE